MMYILALDPATNTGWALHYNGRIVAAGVWNLKPKRDSSAGMRAINLRTQLNTILKTTNGEPLLVAYEVVARHKGVHAAHCYGGLVSKIQEWCVDNGAEYAGWPVADIKRFATGKGNANKQAMIDAAAKIWNDFGGSDDEADARFLAMLAASELLPREPN